MTGAATATKEAMTGAAVATFNAIADVSEILRRTLHAGVQSVGASCIIHDLVAAPSTAMTLSLTLYEVAEDPSSRNRPDIRQVVNNQVQLTRSPTASTVPANSLPRM